MSAMDYPDVEYRVLCLGGRELFMSTRRVLDAFNYANKKGWDVQWRFDDSSYRTIIVTGVRPWPKVKS